MVTENPVIQTVLARPSADAGLLPRGDERATVEAQSMLAWFFSEIQPAVGRQRFPGVFSDAEGSLERIRVFACRELEKAFTILERRLTDRDWLFGEWSIVDAHMLWLWFRAIGSGMDGAAFPRCAEHAQRSEERPSVIKVLDREEAEFARFQQAGTVPASVPPFQVGRTHTL